MPDPSIIPSEPTDLSPEESSKPKLTYWKIEVACPVPQFQTYTYLSNQAVQPGARLIVPFATRELPGICLTSTRLDHDQWQSLHEQMSPRMITRVIDDLPWLSAELLKLARWLADYYLCPIGIALQTVLPFSASKSSAKHLRLTRAGLASLKSHGENPESFLEDQALILTTLKSHLNDPREMIGQKDLMSHFPSRPRALLATALELGWVKETTTKALRVADYTIAKPQPKNVRCTGDLSVEGGLALSQAQTSALQAIEAAWQNRLAPVLLRGITGSGKTEVYLQLIAKLLREDPKAQILVLVPEIALTPQMMARFDARFPGHVQVTHSQLKPKERWSVWQSMRFEPKARILLGPRSSIFAPFRKLSMIIVDEEHDSSYKQEQTPPYNGRDLAIVRARLEGARVLLGSATPSLESFENANRGKYTLVELLERAGGAQLPRVHCIKHAVKKRPAHPHQTQPLLSDEVIAALKDTQQRGEQAIVLVNRRGYAQCLYSRDEKSPVLCPNCSISLTLHGFNEWLRCHYCNYTVRTKSFLQRHPDQEFTSIGSGSQRVESYLQAQLPELRIERIDSDRMQDPDLLHATLDSFRQGETHVLVGTQMLAKGHDFPKVTLVVIVDPDHMLSLPDFRSGERAFQLMVQASGRAGRGQLLGNVMIQSQDSLPTTLATGLRHDFIQFAQEELAIRSQFGYPPFSRCMLIEVSTQKEQLLPDIERRLHAWLNASPHVLESAVVRGPGTPPVERIRSWHRRNLIIMAKKEGVHQKIGAHFLQTFNRTRLNHTRIRIDIDPQSLM